MPLERIEVRSREEYRGDQEPLCFQWRGKTYGVARIRDRWYEGRLDSTRLPLRYFRVETEEGEVFLLRHHELFRAWSIVMPAGEWKSEPE